MTTQNDTHELAVTEMLEGLNPAERRRIVDRLVAELYPTPTLTLTDAPAPPAEPKPLDPNPLNELGKGTLDPEVEATLLARGCVFAQTVTGPHGQYLRTSQRPINDCYAAAITGLAGKYRSLLLHEGVK